MDYERQKELDRQREIDRTRKALLAAAIATKDAVEENARQTKIARIEQSESLKRQEEIADESNFRNTVLRTIPLVSKEELPDYIIQQISNRLQIFNLGYLRIKPYNFHQLIGTETILEGLIDEFRKSNDGKDLIQKIKTQKSLVEYDGVKPDEINEAIQNSEEKKFMHYACAGIWFVSVCYQSVFKTNQGFLFGILFFMYMNIPTLILFYFRKKHIKILKSYESYNSIENDVKPIIESVKKVIVKNLSESKRVKDLTGSELAIAKMYFEEFVFPAILEEQSFLPPNCQIGLEYWKKSKISSETIDEIKNNIKSIESDVSKKFNRDWIYSYRYGFFYESMKLKVVC